MNSGPTSWTDTLGWKLVLERTVQPPEGGPGTLQKPEAASLASDGRLITVDMEPPAIREYDQAGRLLRTLGKRGDGPGEFQRPFVALFRDTLFIHDPAHRRLTVMTLDGKVVQEMPTAGNDIFPIYTDARGRIAIRQSVWKTTFRGASWVWYGRNGVAQDSIAAPEMFLGKEWKYSSREGPESETVPFGARGVIHLLADGTAVVGRTDRYELVVTRTGRDTLRVFGRSNPPLVTIPKAIRDSVFHSVADRNPALKSVADEKDVSLTYPPWQTLQHDGAGNIWVGSRGSRERASRFDVFAPDGRLLGSIAAPFDVRDAMEISGDRVTVIDTDSDDLPRIRIFRIKR